MNLTPGLRRASVSDPCVYPVLLRRFTLIKILILLLLVTLVLLLPPGSPIMAPMLEKPPAVILAGELQLAGEGTPGSTVAVLANDSALGESKVAESGRWLLPAAFQAGGYRLLAQAVSGNERIPDTQGPVELAVVDPPTLAFSAPHTREKTIDVLLFGEGTPGSTLRLLWNEERIGTITVPTTGEWQHSLPTVAVPSENAFLAQVLDGDGAVLATSAAQQLNLLAPVPLAIEQVAFDRLARNRQQKLVDGELQVTGKGEPGARITLRREGASIGPATSVAPDGRWAVTVQQSLPSGDHPFDVRMSAPDNGWFEEGTSAVRVPPVPTLAVAGGATDADDVLLSGTAQADDSLTLYVNDEVIGSVDADGTGNWQFPTHLNAGRQRILARSAAGLDSDPAELTVALARPVISGQSRDAEGKVVPGFFGTGRPQVKLEILAAGTVIGRASVDANGEWVCSCTLAPGEHTVAVREVEEPERSSRPLTLTVENPVSPFVPGTAAPDAPPFRCPDDSPPGVVEGAVYIVGCGESLSLIGLRLGASVEALLAHNPQLSDPARVYFGQRLNVPAGAACFDAVEE